LSDLPKMEQVLTTGDTENYRGKRILNLRPLGRRGRRFWVWPDLPRLHRFWGLGQAEGGVWVRVGRRARELV